MSPSHAVELRPFGQADCESELRLLHDQYSDLYFDETPFNDQAVHADTYLIIGRRGSGKTALAQYFSFGRALPNSIYIAVDEPSIYQQVLSDIAAHSSHAREVAIPKIEKVWDYVLWCVIFEHARPHSSAVSAACNLNCEQHSASGLIDSLIRRLHDFLREGKGELDDSLNLLLSAGRLQIAKQETLRLAQQRPIVIVLDTLEKYDTSNDGLMNALAALIQCAAKFNGLYSARGIHLKVLMSGEVYPFLEEEVLQNPSKSVLDPVHLFWRPKDLLRLISWRFFRYLSAHDIPHPAIKQEIDWTSHKDVLRKMWIPFFGESVQNRQGIEESTFYYVLRHTQMRPRQLILLCNSIAKLAQRDGTFPSIRPEHLRDGVMQREEDLALEVINSFSSLYPNIARIVDALIGTPMLFRANELARRAPRTASAWNKGTYTQAGFTNLVSELGIVGKIRQKSGAVIEAEFEYSLRRRLGISIDDECAIHPMFYSRLSTRIDQGMRVVPFAMNHDS
jgi:hypothetical protein